MQFKVFKRRLKNTLLGNADNTAMDAQIKEMADARYGALYFLAKTEQYKRLSFSPDAVGNFIINTEPVVDAKNFAMGLLKKTSVGKKLASAASVVGEATDAVIEKIKGMIAGFFKSHIEKVKTVFGHLLAGAEWVTELGMWLTSEFAGSLASFIPGFGYVQSIADIYSGVKQAILKTRDFATQMYAGKGVELLGGHPAIIANALARHSAVGIAGGVKGTVMGFTSIGLEAAGDAAGMAGTIVSAVTGILERIVDAVDKIVQYLLVKRVLKRAKKEWDNRGSMTAMANDHDAFSNWFQNVVVTTPVIAAMVMGSGFVAHPQKFLQLITPTNKLNKSGTLKGSFQAQYDKGVSYIETLKKLSGSYVEDYLDSYSVGLRSEDGIVSARLNELTGGKALLDGYEFAVIPTWAIKSPQQQMAATQALADLAAAEGSVRGDSIAAQARGDAIRAGMNP
ncbi:MAG: hypothetical protein ACPGUD_09965 [Parashewanella sp.]